MKKVTVIALCFFSIRLFGQVTTFTIDSSKFKTILLPVLDSIYQDDQQPRLLVMSLKAKGSDSVEFNQAVRAMKMKDSSNLVKVTGILNDYGWLGPQDVGFNGSQALFLVIQHADLQTQRRYLPMIQKAEKEGRTFSSNLAILEDRIAMREGRRQLYGSQGFRDKETGKNYIYPVVDPENLESRRKAMGLTPMEQYVKGWNLDAYMKELPEIEKIAKRQNIH
ncbi:MAG: hypothetical protein J7539_13015 [Niabella sp.]|nr:hypothetical protein [Niabella sp.]